MTDVRRHAEADVSRSSIVSSEPGLEIDEIVAMLSHELRTPLSTIAGYLEIIAEELEGNLQPRYRMILEAGQRNVSRMTRLLDDLLTISHDGLMIRGAEPVDVGVLLREVVDDLGVYAVRRSVELLLDVPDEPLVVTGNSGQLHRACVNLVGNALKFSHEGGRVAVALSADGPDAVIQVVDRGIGIPAQDLAHLGRSFFRSGNAIERHIPGTGLGLRIVQLIADAHGGRVEISSEEGRGTTVRLHIQGPDVAG